MHVHACVCVCVCVCALVGRLVGCFYFAFSIAEDMYVFVDISNLCQ